MADERNHFEIPKDNIRTEKYEKTGGGAVFQRVNHSEHGRKLLEQTVKLRAVESNKRDSAITESLFLQIETPSELSVKSEKVKLEKLGLDVISYSSDNKSIGTAMINKAKLQDLEQRMVEYAESKEHTGKTYFSIIEDISSIPPENKIKVDVDYGSEEEVSITINLYNALSRKERLAINQTIIEDLKKVASSIDLHHFANGVTSISCNIKAIEIPVIASNFTTIKEIKKNYITFVTTSIPIQAMPNPLTIEKPESQSVVCVVDSGINNSNGIFDSLVVEQLKMIPYGAIDCTYEHGSFVASRCVFGDNVDACLGSHKLTPYCRLLDVQVFGKDGAGNDVNPNEFHLRKVIEHVVVKYHKDVRVYNLSLGSSIPIKDFSFSELAKLLDFLSKQFNVLFVISSGNIDVKLGDFPSDHFSNSNSRIGLPAESILSLTVGSVAKFTDGNSLSESNEVSPFSRIGPGADLGIKPELVAHGGNLIKPYNFSPRVSSYGISSDGKQLAVDVGTSYSAPIIAQFAQRLFDLYPNSNPNLIRALLCHFTTPQSIHDEITGEPIYYVGFGEPNINSALTAGRNNAAYIYEGQLDQDNYQYIKFHIPSQLAPENTDTRLKVKITVTYDPLVNPDNEAEYSMSRISAQLTKPTDQGMKPINISGEDKYSLPWNPITKFEKTFSRYYFTGAWELRLRLYTRGNVDPAYLQNFAVVIEIIDEGGTVNVYDKIAEEFAGVYKTVEIRRAA